MSAESAAPSGPDLAAGISPDEVPEGGSLGGHVGDDPVLLARVGGEWLAIGAVCTHYGGPLPEGLIVGDTVRCPWHHACFSLRSGRSLRPPALHDVACYDVEVRDGKVRVTGRKAAPAAPRSARARGPDSVLIVGGGAAGDSAAATLRREGYAGPLTIVDADPDAPYDRPNCSKDYLAGNAPEEWLPLRPADYDRDQGIERLSGRRATELDPRNRRVRLDDGTTRDYGALLLATGATPARLKPEVDRDGAVYYLRSLADCRAIIAAAESARRAVVLGASFIGLEVAASLRARGLEVRVAAPDTVPLGRVLGPELGDFVRQLHEEQGVVFHLGRMPKEIRDRAVLLDDGRRLEADLVVAGIGVRPNLELAEAAGLELDRGVAVNERLETSAPGVFAAGDIARWPYAHTGDRIRVEHWVVAQRLGQAAALSMLGELDRFDAVPFFWSQHYDLPIAYTGYADPWDRIEVEGRIADRDAAVRYIRGDRTLALATIYRDEQSLRFEAEHEVVSSHLVR